MLGKKREQNLILKKQSDIFVDDIIKPELDKAKYRVLNRDLDFVFGVDGEEGSGKSVLAMQLCKYLDPNFNIDRIVFNSDAIIALIKDPNLNKGSAILLDEAYNAANSRATMSEVNRSLIAVATEMRQKNLFVCVVLPSFFDLDKALAIWRTRALFHVYFSEDYKRGQYTVFPKNVKKDLYLKGKKNYNYHAVKSPYPPCRFFGSYVVNEDEYRLKKSEAFKKRTVSNQAKKWLEQRNAYIKYLYKEIGMNQEAIAKIPTNYGAVCPTQEGISYVLKELLQENAAF